MRGWFFQARKFDGENIFRAQKTNFPVWSQTMALFRIANLCLQRISSSVLSLLISTAVSAVCFHVSVFVLWFIM